MERYKKFVLEAEEGIAFETSEGTSGELIIRALSIATNEALLELPTVSAGEYAEVLSVYTDDDGNKAIVPPGWTVSRARKERIIWGKNKGMVIYRIPKRKVNNIKWSNKQDVESLQRTYDQLVWVPVSLLEANGTLDGISFTEKFGRRNYRYYEFSEIEFDEFSKIKFDEFSETEFHETLTGKLKLQFESVKKYGGFYISRYNISKSKRTDNPRSVKGVMPWTEINFDEAKKVASTIEDNEAVKSHLTFGAEYDSVLEWFIKSNARTLSEIAEDSSNWGNNCDTKNSPRRLAETGSREECCTNNIYDFAGNVDEWTQEKCDSFGRVIRGSNYYESGKRYVVTYRYSHHPDYDNIGTGFRVTLYIK